MRFSLDGNYAVSFAAKKIYFPMTFCIKVLHRLSYTVGIVTADSCHKGIFDVVIKHYHGYVMPTVALDKVNMRAKSEEKDTLIILINDQMVIVTCVDLILSN